MSAPNTESCYKVAGSCPRYIFGNKAATDGTNLDLNIGETSFWRLGFFGPNLQPKYDQPCSVHKSSEFLRAAFWSGTVDG